MVAAHPRRTRCKGCGLLPRRGHGKHAGGTLDAEKLRQIREWAASLTPEERERKLMKRQDNMPKTGPRPPAPTPPAQPPPSRGTHWLSRNGGPLDTIDEGMGGGGVCTMGCKTRKHRKGCGFWGSAAKLAKKYVTVENIRKAADLIGRVAPIAEKLAPERFKAKLRKVGEVAEAVHGATKGLGVGVRAKRKRGGSAYTSEAELDRMRKGKLAGAPHRVDEEWNPSGATDSGYKKIDGVWYRNSIAGLHPISGVPPGYNKYSQLDISKLKKFTGWDKKKGGGAFDSEFDRVDPIDRALWNRQKRARVSAGHSSMPNRGFY